MSTQVQIRKGNTAQTAAFTGAIAELTVDTDKKVVVVHDGTTAGGIPLSKESTASTIFNHANGAFDKANSANVLAQAGYNQANTATTSAQAAFDKANQTAQLAFTTVSANGTSLVADANNDTLTITSAVANGIFVSGNSSTDALDIGLINSGVTASGYGDSISVPTFVVDSKGRLTSASNTTIRSGTTSQTGVVQLQDSVTSTSTSNAATPASVKTAYDLATTANNNAVNAGTYANAAFDKANSANVLAQSGYNQANTATTTAGLAYNHANGAFDKANSATTTVGLSYDHANGAFNQANTATTTAGLAYTHANGAFDKANTATTTADAAFAKANSANVIAQSAFDNSNTKFNSSGGSITGDVSVTGNLTIIGQTIYANTTTALIADNIITLNAAINQASAPTVDAGFEIDRGSSANVSLLWNETSDKWTFTNDGTNYFNIADAGRLDSVYTHANGAFDKSNTATTTADSAYTHANGAFTVANSATTTAQNAYNLANGTAGVANTDFTTLTASAGTYGNASHVTVTTLTANGRISSITNTAIAIDTTAITSGTLADARLPTKGTAGTYANAAYIPVITTDAYGRVTGVTNTSVAIDTAQITSGTIADARLPTKGTAGTYANSTYIPVITTDAYGRVTAITNTVIQSSTTSVQGIVQLNDTVTSTSTSVAATANAVNATYNFAATKFNSSGGSISGTVSVTGNVYAGNVIANSAFTSLGGTSKLQLTDIGLVSIQVAGVETKFGASGIENSPGIYGGSFGGNKLSLNNETNLISNRYDTVKIQTGTDGTTVNDFVFSNTSLTVPGGITANGFTAGGINVVPTLAASFSTANAAFTRANNSLNVNTGGSITGDVTVTGNLTIVGQTVYANTTTALIADNIITLNAAIGQASAPTVNAGIEVDRGSSANVLLLWNETTDKWQFTNDGSTYFDVADAGRLDSVFSLANGTAGVANTDYTTISATAGVYGNAAFHPVVTLTANGRVSSITNTAISIDTGALSSGTIADARLPTKGTAGTYGNTTYLPVITTDAYGRVTAITNTAIQAASTSVAGIAQLNDTITSTSTTQAATANSVKTAYTTAAGDAVALAIALG
jgi:hypothetical protein